MPRTPTFAKAPSFAVDFDAASESYSFGDLATVPDSDVDFTIETWNLFTSLAGFKEYIGKATTTTGWYFLAITSGSASFRIAFDDARVADLGNTQVVNEWTYHCFVHNAAANTVQGYYGSKPGMFTVGTLTSAIAGPTTSSGAMRVGSQDAYPNDGGIVRLALTRVWSSALREDQLRRIWDKRFLFNDAPYPGLAFLWDANLDAGSAAIDQRTQTVATLVGSPTQYYFGPALGWIQPRLIVAEAASSFDPTQEATETGAGVDANSGIFASTITEASSGADASTQQYAAAIAETGSGTDTASALHANTAADSGTGIDVLSALVASMASDTASASDAVSAAQAGAVDETGTAVDTPTGLIAATVADTASGADAASATSDEAATSADTSTGVDTIASVYGAATADSATGTDLPAGFIMISVADVATAIDLAYIGPFPPIGDLPYQGDAYIYDSAGGTGSIANGTVLAGGPQSSPTGTVSGASVQPSPTQASATGSISGGTVLPPETII